MVEMPKVINKDIIDKIAQYAGRNHAKSATAKELGLDRTTVRKYWPREQRPEEGKEGEEAKPKLSIEEEFDLLTKKRETELELESLQIRLEDTEGETEDLIARSEVALEQIKVLREKLG